MKRSRRIGSAMKLWGLTGVLMLVLSPAAAVAQRRRSTLPSWYPRLQRSQRVLLVLPAQLGEGWNADPRLGQSILSDADQTLVGVLRGNPEYSLVTVHRFSPVLMRAVADRLITQDQFNTLVTAPTVENARTVLAQLPFAQTPLIATFVLEQINLAGGKLRPGIMVQSSARLYELGNDIALRTSVMTSPPQNNSKQATADAIRRAALDLVSPPLGPAYEIPPLPPAGSYSTTPIRPGTTPGTGTASGTVTLPGDVPIEGASTRPPTGAPSLPATATPIQPAAGPANPPVAPVGPANPPVAPVTPPVGR
jgi:hypothetical protein